MVAVRVAAVVPAVGRVAAERESVAGERAQVFLAKVEAAGMVLEMEVVCLAVDVKAEAAMEVVALAVA